MQRHCWFEIIPLHLLVEFARTKGMTEAEREALVKAIRREFANYKDL